MNQEMKDELSEMRRMQVTIQKHADRVETMFLEVNKKFVEFEKFNDTIKDKCKVIILSSSDNKRDIDKIVNNDYVIKFITKPLTETALEEINLVNS